MSGEMKIDDEMLSAYLDGELSDDVAARVEAALAEDMALQGQLAALIEADQAAQEVFAAQLSEPVPEALTRAIEAAPLGGTATGPRDAVPMPEPAPITAPEPANIPTPPATSGWAIAAAVAGALLIGGAGGLYFGSATPSQPAAVAAWIEDIADYHAVYAQQVRHLVEVPAAEADHIETWLTGTLGATVTIPDLAPQGLTFEGARLLVAAGRPVAQLLYTDADGAVVALCQIQSDSPQPDIREDRVNAFSLVSWGGSEANFVIVTDEGRSDLDAIVRSAAEQV